MSPESSMIEPVGGQNQSSLNERLSSSQHGQTLLSSPKLQPEGNDIRPWGQILDQIEDTSALLQKNFQNFIRDSDPDDHNVIDSDDTDPEDKLQKNDDISEDLQDEVGDEYQEAEQFLDDPHDDQISDESSDNNFGQRGTQAFRPNLLMKQDIKFTATTKVQL